MRLKDEFVRRFDDLLEEFIADFKSTGANEAKPESCASDCSAAGCGTEESEASVLAGWQARLSKLEITIQEMIVDLGKSLEDGELTLQHIAKLQMDTARAFDIAEEADA